MAESSHKNTQQDNEAGATVGEPVKTSVSPPLGSVAAPALAKAPEAIKRSMPLAISVMMGLLLAGLGAWLFYNLTWFILLFYLSFVLATIVEAPVAYLKRRGVPRPLATVVILLGSLLLIGGLIYLLIASLNHQLLALGDDMKKVPQRITSLMDDIKRRFPGLGEYMGNFDFGDAVKALMPSMSNFWAHLSTGFHGITYMIVCFFMVMYMVIEGPGQLKAFRKIFAPRTRPEATRMFEEIAGTHRKWFIVSVGNVGSAALLTATGLWLLGIPGAVILGVVAGFGELIPNVGPVLFALPAVFYTFVMRPDLIFWVIVMFLIVQTIQSYTISPLLMKVGVKLPVLATIVAVLVMGVLFGLLGVLVAIPLTADLVVVWNTINARLEADPADNDTANRKPDEVRRPPVLAETPKRNGLFHKRVRKGASRNA